MRYLPIVGLILAFVGLFRLDWVNIAIGLLLFFGGFAVDQYKKRGVLQGDKLTAAHDALTKLIRIVRLSFEQTDDHRSPKANLAQGLFYVGMVDAASQSADMSDTQFLTLFQATFYDLGFGNDFNSRLLAFHQSTQTSHYAYVMAAACSGRRVRASSPSVCGSAR